MSKPIARSARPYQTLGSAHGRQDVSLRETVLTLRVPRSEITVRASFLDRRCLLDLRYVAECHVEQCRPLAANAQFPSALSDG